MRYSPILGNIIISFLNGECGSLRKNPALPIVKGGNRLSPGSAWRSAATSPEWCIFQYAGLPRGSLTWSEPLCILFIILHLVISLFTRCAPAELFLHSSPPTFLCTGEVGLAGRASSPGLSRDVFSVSADVHSVSCYHRGSCS